MFVVVIPGLKVNVPNLEEKSGVLEVLSRAVLVEVM